jgi:hypothetical protein
MVKSVSLGKLPWQLEAGLRDLGVFTRHAQVKIQEKKSLVKGWTPTYQGEEPPF